MIFLVLDDSEGAVELFEENDPDQIVGEGQARESYLAV